jgi:hypothetical protein
MVSAAATDLWQFAKSGFARLLGREEPARVAVVEQELEQGRTEVLAAGPDSPQSTGQQAAWTRSLEGLLREHPDAAEDLRRLIEQIATAATREDGGVTQIVTGSDNVQQAIQGRGLQINKFGDGG